MTAEVARAMTERELRECVVEAAQRLGYRLCYWTWRSDHSPAGFPDLVLIRTDPPRLIVAELKREGKQPTPAQIEWRCGFLDCGVPAFTWRPSDWLDGTIIEMLERT